MAIVSSTIGLTDGGEFCVEANSGDPRVHIDWTEKDGTAHTIKLERDDAIVIARALLDAVLAEDY